MRSNLEDKFLLNSLVKEQQQKFENQEVQLCPRCMMNHLDVEEVMNSASRLNGDVYICNDCGNDEAFADSGMFPSVPASEWEIFKKKN